MTATADGMRAHNEGVVTRLVWADQGLSRADLSRQTGLSRSTVSAIVGGLLEAGLLQETRPARHGSGRPPIGLAFRDDAFGIVGLAMGASHLQAVLCDPRGCILHREHAQLPVAERPFDTIARLHRFVEACLEVAADRRVIGIGLAVPCPLDSEHEGTLSRRILPAWEGILLGDQLHARHGLPVFVDNDANLGALAEHWWGASTTVTTSTYIKVGTGVGAGHIIDGRLFRGAAGIAGEIGHTSVAGPDGRPCRCGLRGCLEAEIGSGALLDQARERRDAAGEAARPSDAGPPSVGALVEAARAGDPLAVAVVERAGQRLGQAVANLLNLMNPARVVIGGRLATAGDLLLEPLRREIHERALSTSLERAEVVTSQLGPDAVALGAATLVLEAALAAPRDFTRPRRPAPGVLPTRPVRARSA